MKKSNIVFALVLVMLFGPIGSVCAESISFTLNPNPYEIVRDSEGFNCIIMEGYRSMGVPGNPLLPCKVFNILVPPDIIWDTLELSVKGTGSEILPGTYNIRPAAPDAAGVNGKFIYDWGSSKNILDGKNMDIYGKDAFFPVEYLSLLPYSQMRKWKYTKVGFYPLQYNPVSGQLNLINRAEIEISFQRTREKTSSELLNDKVMDHLAPNTFYNYKSGLEWYAPPVQDDPQGEDSGSRTTPPDQPNVASHDYVIITTNAIVTNSQKLAGFISHKASRGFSVLVVTETDFSGLAGQSPNHKAEKIRQWLINNYAAYGIEYVLLIGNPSPYESGEGDIPMKMCWPRHEPPPNDQSPTDGFYADLTGNWNIDGNDDYGEWSDYTTSGGVDFAMEVWVGRIPVYSADYTTLDNILQKIINYEKRISTHWRKNILLPMGFQDPGYDGAPLGEQMRDDYLTPRGWSSWRQYQQGNGTCSLDSAYSSEEELRGGTVVRDRWAANYFGIVCWWGHGSETSALVGYNDLYNPPPCWDGILFSNTQTSVLDDTHPSFTYQCSCTNGYPENSSNLQYSILKKGGISTVGASRVSYFNAGVGYGAFDGSSTNSGIGYEYVERLTRPLPGGRALYEAKLAVASDIPWASRLMNQYDFNLYGDPSVTPSIIGGLPFLPLLLLD